MFGYIGSAVIAIIVVIAGVFLIMYNTLVMLRNNVSKAWSNIDVLLQQRHDLIPKLVDTVKGYESYEQNVLIKLTKLRTSWSSIQKDDVKAKADASNQISQTLKTLFAVSEKYPDLKASQTYIELQNELIAIENQIADRREFYNDSVNEYNIKIKIIPYSIFSSSLHYSPLPYFQASDDDKQPVDVAM